MHTGDSHSNSVQNNTRVFPLQGAANRKTTISNGHWEVFQIGEDFKYHTVWGLSLQPLVTESTTDVDIGLPVV